MSHTYLTIGEKNVFYSLIFLVPPTSFGVLPYECNFLFFFIFFYMGRFQIILKDGIGRNRCYDVSVRHYNICFDLLLLVFLIEVIKFFTT